MEVNYFGMNELGGALQTAVMEILEKGECNEQKKNMGIEETMHTEYW